MDSVTQIVLGASIAGACAPREHRRKALLLGAGLGTLPDLDVFIDYVDAVRNFTYHRGFSHSLLVLAPVSMLLWLALKRWWAPVQQSPGRWLAAIALTLLTHPLLDAHTAYGTQLFWPLAVNPSMWGTLFIIDPLYTLPLLVAVLIAAISPLATRSTTLLRAGLVLSTLYLGWSWVAQGIVERNARDALAALQLQDAPLFVTPTPLNTLLWRVVALTDDGHLEGFDSLVIADGPIQFTAYASDSQALREAADVWAVARLRWFSSDFLQATVEDDELLLTDLRMGQAPSYVFSHIVAARGNPHWKSIPTRLQPVTFGDRALADTWKRIWEDSPQE